ncbi:uncharacterized protein G2W53_020781 [Senna tora]|uniref:Uncharacterized protein n=1 Tax=Senna tora TaxID=362788 RepID=A0A834WH92_9FABA|nr:uncharacterized protein G2W53_020781 [Senna tora]
MEYPIPNQTRSKEQRELLEWFS